jgi:mRNA-degrading endonuclease YafQ of YafQ-DinJ toxin-antitoxin module
MRITLTEHFQKDFLALSRDQKEKAFEVLLNVPNAVGDTHRHSGIGLRKIHRSGIYEARIGLGLRMVFAYQKEAIVFHRIGNHDAIRKYLKKL